jgi:hypothetical protein
MAFDSFLVIFTLMLVYYNTAGWVANTADLNLLSHRYLSAMHATLPRRVLQGCADVGIFC